MKNRVLLLAAVSCVMTAVAQEEPAARFAGELNYWKKASGSVEYGRYDPTCYREIADNIVAYQNEDGGWPKNLDMAAKLNPDSVKLSLKPRSRLSTLDNGSGYRQVEYLANVYEVTGDTVYRDAAVRGMEYMLATQYPNGGWRGWDADAVTYNDGIIYGVLATWLEIVYGKEPYDWVDGALRERICRSWERGLELVLKTQYVQHGVKTVWAQQYDHATLQPVKARAYELPALSACESADIVMLLMRIRNPSPEVVEAVKAAVAWYEKTKITGRKVVTVKLPEEQREDPKIKVDRIVVEDPDADPMWARYCDLEDNRPFFSTRAGGKVYELREVPAERRVGYSWYGEWGEKVLKKYPQWLAKLEKKRAKKVK